MKKKRIQTVTVRGISNNQLEYIVGWCWKYTGRSVTTGTNTLFNCLIYQRILWKRYPQTPRWEFPNWCTINEIGYAISLKSAKTKTEKYDIWFSIEGVVYNACNSHILKRTQNHLIWETVPKYIYLWNVQIKVR